MSWIGRVRLERGEVGRGSVDVVVCHQLGEREVSSGYHVLGWRGVVRIERRLVQNFLDVGAVKIDRELADVRGGWQIWNEGCWEEITELALVGRPNCWDRSVFTVLGAALYLY